MRLQRAREDQTVFLIRSVADAIARDSSEILGLTREGASAHARTWAAGRPQRRA
jgi:hypothetical protein